MPARTLVCNFAAGLLSMCSHTIHSITFWCHHCRHCRCCFVPVRGGERHGALARMEGARACLSIACLQHSMRTLSGHILARLWHYGHCIACSHALLARMVAMHGSRNIYCCLMSGGTCQDGRWRARPSTPCAHCNHHLWHTYCTCRRVACSHVVLARVALHGSRNIYRCLMSGGTCQEGRCISTPQHTASTLQKAASVCTLMSVAQGDVTIAWP